MAMISYGQDHEDVMLQRAFPSGVVGTYIDVGANDPVLDSVTKHFYDRGWWGINVEPIPELCGRLRADRPLDINLNVGLADREGRLTFYESPEKPGWSTFSAGLAAEYRAGGLSLQERTIPVTTLEQVCEEHVDGPIDFLKIDVEGFEREVLEGADFRRWRPRVVLVEDANADRWEHILLDADYLPAARTAINRFYVRAEDRALLPAFREPVGPGDDFITYQQVLTIREFHRRTARQPEFGPSALGLACWLHREAARHRSAFLRWKEYRPRRASGLLGALALILAIEASLAGHQADFTTPPRLEWRQSAWAASRRAPASSVLCLGTSMTKLGLFPPVIERESGLKAYNLAACAGRLPGSYYLLRRALEAGARPKAVVLEVHPTYLATPFREGLVAWPDLLGPLEALDLARASGDASFFGATTLAGLLPSLNARAEIRGAVLAALRGEPSSTRAMILPHRRNLSRNEGAFVRRNEVPYRGEVSPQLEAMYLPPSWAPDPLNERYLGRILDLCALNEIQVYWLIPPLAPALQARREQLGLDAAYTRFARRIQAAHPGVVVLDSRPSGYDVPVFWDAAHLDSRGATAFSAEVGRILKSGRGGPAVGTRWVALPSYRDRPAEARLEDIAQSFRAVEESGALRR